MKMREKLIYLCDTNSGYVDEVPADKFADYLIANDVIPVVRCKDCKHWHHSGYCRKIGTEHDRLGSDFCSYGGRKDDEGKAN